jgi:hypothetical protein
MKAGPVDAPQSSLQYPSEGIGAGRDCEDRFYQQVADWKDRCITPFQATPEVLHQLVRPSYSPLPQRGLDCGLMKKIPRAFMYSFQIVKS